MQQIQLEQEMLVQERFYIKDNVSIEEIESLSVEKLNEYASFANTYSAYTTLSKGAIESYPNKLDIDRYIEMNKLKEEKIFSE